MISTMDISSIITAICWKKFFSAVNKNCTDRPVILFFSDCCDISCRYIRFLSLRVCQGADAACGEKWGTTSSRQWRRKI